MTITQILTTKRELGAISKYASMCDESISCLVHRIVIEEITQMKCQSVEDIASYDYDLVSLEISYYDEQKIIESNYSKIMVMLGWEQIRVDIK
ncbi:MAG: hypothetical protein HZC29_07900 [Thaumarchaeota archaeon]|nr:hypothetical protein [Nitrososphaerota archaeon]